MFSCIVSLQFAACLLPFRDRDSAEKWGRGVEHGVRSKGKG